MKEQQELLTDKPSLQPFLLYNEQWCFSCVNFYILDNNLYFFPNDLEHFSLLLGDKHCFKVRPFNVKGILRALSIVGFFWFSISFLSLYLIPFHVRYICKIGVDNYLSSKILPSSREDLGCFHLGPQYAGVILVQLQRSHWVNNDSSRSSLHICS